MIKALQVMKMGFYRGLTEIRPNGGRVGHHKYLVPEDFLRETGLNLEEAYIKRRGNMVTEWVENWTILELCLHSEAPKCIGCK